MARQPEEFVRKTSINILKYAHLKNLWGQMKMADEIIKELWKIKDAIAKEYGYDVKALLNYLKTKRREVDYQVVDLRSIKQAAEHKVGLDQG